MEDDYPVGTSFERVGINLMIAHIEHNIKEILKSHLFDPNTSPMSIAKGHLHLDVSIQLNRAAQYINLAVIVRGDDSYPADDHLAEEQFALHFDRAMEGV